MNLQPRCYQGDNDLGRMLALLQAGRAAQVPSYYIHTGDLLWWLYYPPFGVSWWENIYLWDDPTGEPLLGWALLEPTGESLDVYVQPELYGSPQAEAMLAWACAELERKARTARRSETAAYWVIPEDSMRIRWLEEHGYRQTSTSPALARPLKDPIPDVPLPAGFQARPCRGLIEVEQRALAQYGAFDSQVSFEQYIERFERFMRSPAYDPEGDLVVAAPDGRIAAFCIIWIDSRNRVGLFEPVGTHPDFQRQGFGRGMMLAGLRRLQSHGMREAIITTGSRNAGALRLYEALGFRQYNTFCLYTKKLVPPAD